ncbi:hypothetical protein E4G14_17650, partial [Salmonella enterica]|nr:hypothetical protein [Salmonella enterica]EAV4802753.1 hypothetical protein [Salmonella enterica]ECD2133062.1 hypothetical protein [Salmonella enterica subsp. enterica serovar Praha]
TAGWQLRLIRPACTYQAAPLLTDKLNSTMDTVSQDRHKLPGIRQVKKPILQDGLFCVLTGGCTVGWRLRLIRPTGIIPPTKLVFL